MTKKQLEEKVKQLEEQIDSLIRIVEWLTYNSAVTNTYVYNPTKETEDYYKYDPGPMCIKVDSGLGDL